MRNDDKNTWNLQTASLEIVGTLSKGYRRIDLFAETYHEVSIINYKRLGGGASLCLMINSPASKVPSDFTKFINFGENKTRLINLICEVISSDYKRALALLKCNEICFSKENNRLLFNKSGIHNAARLKSHQEEANSKVILHCLDAPKGFEATFVIHSSSADLDIMVTAVSLLPSNEEHVFLNCGNGKNHKAIKFCNVILADDLNQALDYNET